MAKKPGKSKVEKLKAEPTDKSLLNTIFKYIPQIARERDLDKLLVLLADMGRDLIVADRCTVWLIDEDTQTLWSKVAHGVDRIVIPRTAGIAGHVSNSGKTFITNDPYKNKYFDKDVDIKTGYVTRNIIALPIQDSQGNTIGVYQAVNKMTKSGEFLQADLDHLLLAASYTGKQLESALLQEEIESTQKEIIFTLAETGEMRSKETGNHVKRVAEYSKLLATKCGIDEFEAELLKTASPLHDIGKIAIPDAVLLKPGKLNKEERRVIETHANLGYQMLRHSERRILHAASIVAGEHHEKWTGDGYPRMLKGEEIHHYGRITAIADVFDALGSDRVYKKAWETDRVFELFKTERGKHFDPEMTDVFLDSFEEFLLISETYRDVFSDSK